MSRKSFSERRGGGSSAEPNPDTTKYHEDETEMICDVAVQQMRGWWDAITIHDERECDKCVTERNEY
jgi:hypothetical protein